MKKRGNGEKELAEQLLKENISPEKRKRILHHVKDKLEKEKTMKLSIKEGSYSSISGAMGDGYIIPFALTLTKNNLYIGLLRSFSGLLPPVFQPFGSRLMNKISRKKIIVTYVALQALMWLPIMVIALFMWKSLFVSYLPYFLLLFYTLYAVVGAIAGPAWFSLLGDIVPEKIRGKYFGKRNKICGAVALVASLIAAFLLDFFKTRGLVLLGFSLLFFISFLTRGVAALYFRKHYEPRFARGEKKDYFSFWTFLKGFKKYNFTKFTYFVAVMYFAVYVASPFFTVYMLDNLKFSYVVFMAVNLASSLASLLMMPVWGKFSDKYGGRQVLVISSILISIMPVLWFFSSSPYYLMLPMIISGIGWAGFNLSSFNFIYDSVSPKKRGLCVAYFNILTGIGLFLGSAVGGLILNNILPLLNFSADKFLILFLISAILRGLSAALFIPIIKEIKKVEKFRPILKLKHIPVLHELNHDLHVIEKKIGQIETKRLHLI